MFYLNRNLLQKMLQGLPYLPILLKLKTNFIIFNGPLNQEQGQPYELKYKADGT